jgi:hypothetical protein
MYLCYAYAYFVFFDSFVCSKMAGAERLRLPECINLNSLSQFIFLIYLSTLNLRRIRVAISIWHNEVI